MTHLLHTIGSKTKRRIQSTIVSATLCVLVAAGHSAPSVLATTQLFLVCQDSACTLEPTTPLFSVQNAVPGYTQQAILTARNQRNDACALSGSLSLPSAAPTLPYERVFLAVRSAAGDTFLGTLAQTQAQSTVTVADLITQRHVFGYLPPNSTDDFIWYATLDPELGNEYQGAFHSFSLILDTVCDDPEVILPSPSPSLSPSPTALANSPSPAPSVLGVSTDQESECNSSELANSPQTDDTAVHALTIKRESDTSVLISLHYSRQTNRDITVAFQELQTGKVFRHRGITSETHFISNLLPHYEYRFWLEQRIHCVDKKVSEDTNLPALLADEKERQGNTGLVLGSNSTLEPPESEERGVLDALQGQQATEKTAQLHEKYTRVLQQKNLYLFPIVLLLSLIVLLLYLAVRSFQKTRNS